MRPLKLTWPRVERLIREYTEEVTSAELCPDPLVSVLVVTYNHAGFIAENLDSIISQKTSFPFEVLVGDDASSDGTTEIARQYQARHPRQIRLFCSTRRLGEFTGNGRVNCARNWRAARGRYLAILDGDDFWTDPHKLQAQVDFLESHPEYMGSFHDTRLIDFDGTAGDVSRWFRTFGDRLDATLEDTVSPVAPFHSSSFVARREIFTDLPELVLQVASCDMALFVLATLHGPLRRIPKVMSAYRKHAGAITLSPQHSGVTAWLYKRSLLCQLKKHLHPVGHGLFVESIRDAERRVLSAWRAGLSDKYSVLKVAWQTRAWCLAARLGVARAASSVRSAMLRLRPFVARFLPKAAKRAVRSMLMTMPDRSERP